MGVQHVGQGKSGPAFEILVVQRRLKAGDEAAAVPHEPPHNLRGPIREASDVRQHEHAHAVQVGILEVVFGQDADRPMLFEQRRKAPSVWEK